MIHWRSKHNTLHNMTARIHKQKEDINSYKTTQDHLLLALSGFLEEGRHRRLERSSSRKKNLWYCLEFERIFINSEPFCINVRQSAAMVKGEQLIITPKKQHDKYWKRLQILQAISPLIIRLSSGRAMKETDFCNARFVLFPSFFRTLDFLGMTPTGTSSPMPSFSCKLSPSPLVNGDCTSLETTEEESAILIQHTATNHDSFEALRPKIYFDHTAGLLWDESSAVDWERTQNFHLIDMTKMRQDALKNRKFFQLILYVPFGSRLIASRRGPIRLESKQ